MPNAKRDPYTTIKIPDDFMPIIDELLDDTREGFSSRTEVVKTAVREYYNKYLERKEKKEISSKQ